MKHFIMTGNALSLQQLKQNLLLRVTKYSSVTEVLVFLVSVFMTLEMKVVFTCSYYMYNIIAMVYSCTRRT